MYVLNHIKVERMGIEDSVELGQGVKIFHPHLVNLYGCKIGDETKIGSFVEIQKNVIIGTKCNNATLISS